MVDFRQSRISVVGAEDVVNLEYYVAGNRLAEISIEGEKSEFVYPKGLATNHKAIVDYIKSACDAKVNDFLDRPDKDFAKKFHASKEKVRILMTSKEGKEQEISFAGVDKGFWVPMADGTFGLLSDENVGKLTKKLIHFRDRKVFQLESADVRGLSVDGVVYDKKVGDFINRETNEKNGRLYNFMMDLIYAEANEIYKSTNDGLKSKLKGKPNHRVKIFGEGGKVLADIEGWKDQTGKPFVYLKTSTNSDEVYEINQKIFASSKKS